MIGAGSAVGVRAAVLTDLAHRLREVDADGPGLALLVGRAGMGRTFIARALAVAHPGLVLWATAAEWESNRPFGVLDQLVPGIGDSADPIAAGTALIRHVAGADDRVLAVVDDAHWADSRSLQVLSTVVRHHPEARLLVLLTAVSGDPRVTVSNTELVHHVSTIRLELPPLTAAEVGQLAAERDIVLHPSMAEQLCRHTGGVPRNVDQLLDELPEELWSRFDPDLPAPTTVAGRVREALAACAPATRRLVEAVCVLGPDTAVRDAVLLAEIDEGLVAALDEAAAADLIALGPRGLSVTGPVDPMVRSAVLATMGPAAVAAARRRAAELIDDPVRRLSLLVAAAPVPDAALADRLDVMATERAAQGAWAAAATLLHDASRLTEDRLQRERRLTRAVDALIGSGDVFAAAALIPEVESLRETPLRNAVLGYLAIVRGRPTEAENRLARAWDLVNVEREPDIAALICQRYVLHTLCRCRPHDVVRWADRGIGLAGPDTPAAVEASAIRGLGMAYGRMDEARRSYAELTQRVRHGAQVQRIVMGRGWLDLIADEIDEARADLESSVSTTVLGGSARISLWASAWLARLQFLTGDWDDALRTVREATSLLDRTGIILTGPLLQWTAVAVHALRGEWDLAEVALRRTDAGPQDYEIMRLPSCLARAQWAEARADAAGVLRALQPLTQAWARGGADDPGQWPWADMYAHALVAQGRYDEADIFLERHERLAADFGRTAASARLGAARGHLLGAKGELEPARTRFQDALRRLEAMPLRYDRARVGFVYGQILRRAGKRREADVEISVARDIFVALGAETYVTRCDRELKAGGVRVQRADRGIGELTPQEDAVAQLVAQGLSNREVASELFISTKTVQYHLTRVYAKLGIRSRAELAAKRRMN
ncbi:LuxR C-terminal-related transcriptional regulator [Nocardia sp. CA-151230]|uniref:helix-turn-helix transcriptional regulator n=1 Tax=Nocardia sp. CA-151230 TaxID=3239982 RepID=UPI003D91F725